MNKNSIKHKTEKNLQEPSFSGLVDFSEAQNALLLLLVEPKLRGLIIEGCVGSGKTALARAYRSLSDSPFIDLPLGADEDSLFGGLDLEQTLAKKTKVFQQGLISKARGGVLYVDHINLLDPTNLNPLLQILDAKQILGKHHDFEEEADFVLIGTFDSQEGWIKKGILDRIGLHIVIPREKSAKTREQVIQHHFSPDFELWEEEDQALKELLKSARDILSEVEIDENQIDELTKLSLMYGVEGHRADYYALLAARASAALGLRKKVEKQDLKLAFQFVILPRAMRTPATPTEDSPPQQAQTPAMNEMPSEEIESSSQETAQPPSMKKQEQEGQEPFGETASRSTTEDEVSINIPVEEQLSAVDVKMSKDILQFSFQNQSKGSSGQRGELIGTRGRHIRSIIADVKSNKLDLLATLRNASIWQSARKKEGKEGIVIYPEDFRVKLFRGKSSVLFCFMVDTSGSMALNRIRQAKGAIYSLLQHAYVNRDRVALLSFRNKTADLILPPTQSVELTKRLLDVVPIGGKTPLALALTKTLEISYIAKNLGIMETVFILFTDGHGNQAILEGRNSTEEIEMISKQLAQKKIKILVVDTQRQFLSSGKAKKLAEWLGGKYLYLPTATGEEIANFADAIR